MRRLFGFLALAIIPTTILSAQSRSGGSSSSSSASSSSSSSSSGSSYTPPSYSPPASSGSSRSSDSGSSRSYDSGSSRSYDSASRGSSSPSSSSSSHSGGSYSPPSHSGGSYEPGSRGSSTNPSGSTYHSPNNSTDHSSSNIRDLRNHPQVQNRHEFTANVPANRPDLNSGRNGLPSASLSTTSYDPELSRKYAPKQSRILEKQSRLDEEGYKLFMKYKLAGNDQEYARRHEKLEQKRNKLLEKEQKLADRYQLEAARKYRPCVGKSCSSAPCPPGTVAGHRGGCVASGSSNPQCTYGFHPNGISCIADFNPCHYGFIWNGNYCADETFSIAATSANTNCSGYYSRLMEQKRILSNLKQSRATACSVDSVGAECNTYTQQVTVAETIYRGLEIEYTECLAHP